MLIEVRILITLSAVTRDGHEAGFCGVGNIFYLYLCVVPWVYKSVKVHLSGLLIFVYSIAYE